MIKKTGDLRPGYVRVTMSPAILFIVVFVFMALLAHWVGL